MDLLNKALSSLVILIMLNNLGAVVLNCFVLEIESNVSFPVGNP